MTVQITHPLVSAPVYEGWLGIGALPDDLISLASVDGVGLEVDQVVGAVRAVGVMAVYAGMVLIEVS